MRYFPCLADHMRSLRDVCCGVVLFWLSGALPLGAQTADAPNVGTSPGLPLIVVAVIGVLLVLVIVLFAHGARHRRARQRSSQERHLLAEILRRETRKFLILNADGKIDFTNDADSDDLDSTETDVSLGLDFRDMIARFLDEGTMYIPGRTKEEALVDLTQTYLADGSVAEITFRDGRIVQRSARKLSDGRTLLVRTDVTKDRLGLAAEQSHLAAVLDAAQSAIVGLSDAGEITIANQSALEMLGISDGHLPVEWPETIQFLDPTDLTPLAQRQNPVTRAKSAEVLKKVNAVMARGEDAEPRYVQISSAVIGDHVSQRVRTVIIIDDISDYELNRQQLERSSRLDALGQLTGGIAHDFNNLLATIEYGIQLAESAPSEEKRSLYHKTVLASARRGSNLTNRLLAFAKKQPGSAQSKAVEHLFADFEGLVRPTIEEAIELCFVPVDPGLIVHCDISQLENALLNLVLNSRDAIARSGQGYKIVIKAKSVDVASPGDAPRRFSTRAQITEGMSDDPGEPVPHGTTGHDVAFSVSDNGPGMSDEVKRRAIDPFFSTKDATSGTGLGLAMVYGFVQQFAGKFQIFSEPEFGTSISMILPSGDTPSKLSVVEDSVLEATGNGEVVLIVEDQEDLIEVLADVVDALGYSVRSAPNAIEALEILNSDQPVDLLLADAVLPGGMNGFELAKSARDIRPGLPVIYMTGYFGFSDREMGTVPAQLIQKPSSPVEISNAIKNALTPADTDAGLDADAEVTPSLN